MKKVFLIGDSIRINYQPAVAKYLEGVAKVYNPGYTAESEAMEASKTNVNFIKFLLALISCGLIRFTVALLKSAVYR